MMTKRVLSFVLLLLSATAAYAGNACVDCSPTRCCVWVRFDAHRFCDADCNSYCVASSDCSYAAARGEEPWLLADYALTGSKVQQITPSPESEILIAKTHPIEAAAQR